MDGCTIVLFSTTTPAMHHHTDEDLLGYLQVAHRLEPGLPLGLVLEQLAQPLHAPAAEVALQLPAEVLPPRPDARRGHRLGRLPYHGLDVDLVLLAGDLLPEPVDKVLGPVAGVRQAVPRASWADRLPAELQASWGDLLPAEPRASWAGHRQGAQVAS